MVLCSWEARGCGNRPVTRACVQKRLRKPSAAREKGKGKMEGREGRESLPSTYISEFGNVNPALCDSHPFVKEENLKKD